MSVVFLRTDKRTFERAYGSGYAIVAVNKNGRAGQQDIEILPDSSGHTHASNPRLLLDMELDGGKAFNYFVAVGLTK